VGEHIERVYSDVYTETVTTYRENGVTNIEPYKKVAGSVAAGIAILNQLFQDDRIFIASDCLNLIKELHAYEWKTSGQREEPKPGQGDHAIDALRYCITSLTNKPSMAVLSSATPFKPKPREEDPRRIFAYHNGKPIYLD
jgi:phage terminase large subunit